MIRVVARPRERTGSILTELPENGVLTKFKRAEPAGLVNLVKMRLERSRGGRLRVELNERLWR